VLKVAVGALTPKAYGQTAFLSGILPHLAREHGAAKFFLLCAEPPSGLRFDTANIEVVRCQLPGTGSGWARVVWEQTRLPGLIAQLRVDVYYSANNIAVLRSPRPCVIHVRNMEPLTPPATGMPPPVLRIRLRLLRLLTRLSLSTARRVIAASGLVKETVIAMGCPADKVDVIYHGIDDLEASGADAPPRSGYVAAAAKFVRYANLQTAIRGFVHARELGYAGELRVAGGPHDRRYEAEIRALACSLGVASHVRFLGYIERREVLALMRGCDAFVMPSTLEACPFTMLEAMRQGAPIIATTAPPMPEFGGDAPIYVAPHDYRAMGAAIHRIASSPCEQSVLRSRAARRAEDFRWDRTVSQLLEVFNRAACGS
jgi:glycosyltransferase involved in cell wall biosynthesis